MATGCMVLCPLPTDTRTDALLRLAAKKGVARSLEMLLPEGWVTRWDQAPLALRLVQKELGCDAYIPQQGLSQPASELLSWQVSQVD